MEPLQYSLLIPPKGSWRNFPRVVLNFMDYR